MSSHDDELPQTPMNSFRLPLIALALYVTAYLLIRMVGVLYYDRYGFFRAPYFGRYHIAPRNCDSAASPSMLAWYAFLPLHVVEHYGWREITRSPTR